ncbi:MAG: hypothetical protein A2015_01755 [Spirochaetes bacterium GWF1_31_7]|nr:MAG: hypothetical protein A2Y30_00705 [Spirochaetes bacterium GWE1_32_154]OHD45932.1 MAG: hypothetical protein A2Y29_16550 [Spirochaetes bacterium GWE2_31_10]OHD48098.1 MAG: hypothetical protein A2015_01755 [Spirochaetes bacterium GWF1_31_7]OHD78632.1 MAG: hypothetical protein A2355_02465 [Spirochaetes bacterium RIFOXYB1_FULL_32_8]
MNNKKKKLNVVYVFHANQCLNNVILWADKVCYDNFFKMVRKHPKIKLVIHVSGTLLQGMRYFFGDRIETIKQGVEDGQFEILGSTYSQSILYSCNNYDNDNQIKLHKEVINEYFGFTPKGFWNPERCWSQDYVSLISQNGYGHTLIEEKFLKAAGVKTHANLVRTTEHNGQKLTLFTDDLKHYDLMGDVIDKREYEKLIKYYKEVYDNMTDDEEFLVSYANDMEAVGMWQVSNNESAESALQNLDDLFSLLEKEEWLKLTTFEEYLTDHSPTEHIKNIPDGQATWMVDSSQTQGFNDWFDFNKNYEGIVHYRKLYDKLSKEIKTVENKALKSNNIAAAKLLKCAKNMYAIYQYEFGCAFGSSGTEETIYPVCNKGVVSWEAARQTSFMLHAASKSFKYKDEIYDKDIDNDGVVETIVISANIMYIITPIGGKILFCFDLNKGVEIIGNGFFDEWQRKWESNSNYSYSYNFSNFIESVDEMIRFKRKGFEDFIKVNRFYIGDDTKVERLKERVDWKIIPCFANTKLNKKKKGNKIEFNYEYDDLFITKTYSFINGNCEVEYSFDERGRKARRIILNMSQNFALDSIEALMHGKEIFENKLDKQTAYASNTFSKINAKISLITELSEDDDFALKEDDLILGSRFVFDIKFRLNKLDKKKLKFLMEVLSPLP